jgi:hypothetical protein
VQNLYGLDVMQMDSDWNLRLVWGYMYRLRGSWHVGATGVLGDECAIAELANGTVVLNVRRTPLGSSVPLNCHCNPGVHDQY